MPLAVALNAPLPHGFSSVRRLRRRRPPLSTALLSGPDSRQRGTALRPAMRCVVFIDKNLGAAGKAVVGRAPAATLCGAEEASPDTNSPLDCPCLVSGQSARTGAACKARAHGRARAARASMSDSRRLFERSERSERSEFRRGPCDRAPQGSRPAGPTAAHERRRIPGRLCLARSTHARSNTTMNAPSALNVRVTRKTAEAEDICTFELASIDGTPLPAFSAGSHIDVQDARRSDASSIRCATIRRRATAT